MRGVRHYLLETLKQLLNIPSPTGHTDEIKAFTRNKLKEMGYAVAEAKDGLRVSLVEEGTPHLVWASHLDTLGLRVAECHKHNTSMYVACTPVGGMDAIAVGNADVTFFPPHGKSVPGQVVTSLFGRHSGTSQMYVHELTSLWKENSFNCRLDGRAPLPVGTLGAFDSGLKTTTVNNQTYLRARHLDSKDDCAVMLTLLWYWRKHNVLPPHTVSFVFHLEEEPGKKSCSLIPQHADACVGLEWIPSECMPNYGLETVGMIGQDAICSSSLPLMALLQTFGVADFVALERFSSDATLAKRDGFAGQAATIGSLLDNSHGPERMSLEGLLNLFNLMKRFCL